MQSVKFRVIREHRLTVEPIGVGSLNTVDGVFLGGFTPQEYSRVDRLGGRAPRNENAARGIIAPGEMNLFRCAVGRAGICVFGN